MDIIKLSWDVLFPVIILTGMIGIIKIAGYFCNRISNKGGGSNMIHLKNLEKGDFFKRKAGARTVYVRDIYIPSEKKYSCHDAEDVNREILLSGNTEVFTDFEY